MSQHKITIKDGKFDSSSGFIRFGDTIVWENQDEVTHQFVCNSSNWQFDTGEIAPGQPSQPVNTPPTPWLDPDRGHFYGCTIHPSEQSAIVLMPAGQDD